MVCNIDEEILEKWFLIRNISSETQETYMMAVNEYTSLMKKSLNDLLFEAKKENLSDIEIMERKVTINLLKFKKQLNDDGKAPKTVNLYFSAIKSFYKAFNIFLPEIIMDKGDIGLEKNFGKGLEREDILKMVGVASPRERALIYLMALSGMGQQEARDLKINILLDSASTAIGIVLRDVYDLFSHEEQVIKEVLTLNIRRKKVKYRHQTFLPPEASREIINYLKERCYGRNEKIRVIDNYDTIFVNNRGAELSRDSIVTNFRRIGLEAGFQKEKGSYSYWRSHALRKYFISKIINKSGNKIIADYMAGHAISSQDRTYWMAKPEDLKKLYLKALPKLSLEKAQVRDVETKEFKKYIEDSKKKDERISILEKNQEKTVSFIFNLFQKKEFRERYFKEFGDDLNLDPNSDLNNPSKKLLEPHTFEPENL